MLIRRERETETEKMTPGQTRLIAQVKQQRIHFMFNTTIVFDSTTKLSLDHHCREKTSSSISFRVIDMVLERVIRHLFECISGAIASSIDLIVPAENLVIASVRRGVSREQYK